MWQTCNCSKNGTINRCLGVPCKTSKDCVPGAECDGRNRICVDPAKKGQAVGHNCTNDPTARCSKCAGTPCKIPKKGERNADLRFPCLYNCLRTTEKEDPNVDDGICSSCNCDDENIITDRCLGRECGTVMLKIGLRELFCAPGLECVHHYCTNTSDPKNKITCASSTIPRCGRCGDQECRQRTECKYFHC
jgi:hypothetical protein